MRFDLVGGSDSVLTGGVRKTVRRYPQEEVLYAESDSGRGGGGGVRIFWRGVCEKGGSDEPPEPPPPGYGPGYTIPLAQSLKAVGLPLVALFVCHWWQCWVTIGGNAGLPLVALPGSVGLPLVAYS